MTESIKSQFPIFDKYPDLAFLDNAATTQKPKVVIDRITDFYSFENSNIHRAVYDLSNSASKEYEIVREKVRKFLNASNSSSIAFTKGSTESLNIIAKSYLSKKIKPGDNIVISIMEHHANLLPWQKLAKDKGIELRVLGLDENGDLDLDELKNTINSKTKLLSICHISNTIGTINPIGKIIDIAHQKNVPVCIDAAQSAALYNLDHHKLKYDFLVFSAHKIFGPFGAGILFVSEKYLDEIDTYNLGGGMIEEVGIEATTFKSFPYNLEAGTPDIASVIAMGEAIDFIQSINCEGFRLYLNDLCQYAISELSGLNELEFFVKPKEQASIFSFGIKGIHPHDIATFLNKDQIALRAGMHCTQPLLKYLNIHSTVRVSFSIYNDQTEVDRLRESLKELIKFWS